MDKKAFTNLYHQYIDKIYSFTYWRTSDASIAEDITSEVFTKAWVSKESFDGKYPQAWLFTIARNLITDHYRKNHPVIDNELLMDIVDERDTPDQQTEKILLKEKLQKSLKQLPEQAQSIVIWRCIENLPVSEVSLRLGISEGNVRIQQLRALRKLKDIYESIT